MVLEAIPVPMMRPVARRGPADGVRRRPTSAAVDSEREVEDYDDESDESTERAPVHRTFFPDTWLWRLDRMRSVDWTGCRNAWSVK